MRYREGTRIMGNIMVSCWVTRGIYFQNLEQLMSIAAVAAVADQSTTVVVGAADNPEFGTAQKLRQID